MLRLLSLAVCVAALCLSTVVLLIRAQPLDNRTTRAILESAIGCAEPCWQGILPGETSLENALAMLRHHPWTEEPDFFSRIDAISWSWSGAEPTYIDPRRRSILTVRADGIVDGIVLNTVMPLGDFVLWLGQPDVLWVFPNREFIAAYEARRLELKVYLRCPFSAADFWRAPVEVRWRSRLQGYDVFGALPLDLKEAAWREQVGRCSESR